MLLDRQRVLQEHWLQYFSGPVSSAWYRSTGPELEIMKYCPACHRTYPADYNICPGDQSTLQSAHELQPGMVIRNKYEILERIGIGGMGFVYRGRHITFNELCAIKIVNDVIAGDTNFLQRFQTEAVVTRKLRHPNAVRVDDYDYTEDGRPFIVMELVEGQNVGEVLQTDGPFAVPRALRIVAQVARALGVAHKLGIVHRDIKPGNIILTVDEFGRETAKVLDFGIAKLREAAGGAQSGMTMTGMVVGTPIYMSPEQFLGKKGGEIDGRTDLYSLGIVLYQMVTARLPFEGETLYSLMMQHMEGNVRPPHELTPELHIPESLSRVIVKAISKSREERYQTAEDFVAALEQLANDPAIQNSTVELPPNHVPAPGPIRPQASPPPTPSAPPVERPATSAERPAPVKTETPSSQMSPTISLAPTLPLEVPAQPLSSVSKPPVSTPQPPVSAPPVAPASARTAPPTQQPVAGKPSIPVTPVHQPDSMLVKSAEQHLFLQPRKVRARNIILVMVLVIAGAIVVGAGLLKFQAARRVQIENAIEEKLASATSPTLRRANLRVSVSNRREVTLEGDVPTQDDSATAATIAAGVPGVLRVNNQIRVVLAGSGAESSESLINKGSAFLDNGDYTSAIDCFRKAARDPNASKAAQDWLARAQKAQDTEEKLLQSRGLH